MPNDRRKDGLPVNCQRVNVLGRRGALGGDGQRFGLAGQIQRNLLEERAADGIR